MQKLTSEQKERLRKERREQYLRMKQKRDNDPDYIALKELQKEKKKEIYREMKLRRKAEKEAVKADKRKKRNEDLLKMVHTAEDIKTSDEVEK